MFNRPVIYKNDYKNGCLIKKKKSNHGSYKEMSKRQKEKNHKQNNNFKHEKKIADSLKIKIQNYLGRTTYH